MKAKKFPTRAWLGQDYRAQHRTPLRSDGASKRHIIRYLAANRGVIKPVIRGCATPDWMEG